MRAFLAAVLLGLVSACSSLGLPKGVEPVNDFELEKYLGQWFEIARFDSFFERGLDNVTATYSLRDDGGVVVLNRGYSVKKNQWKEATGKAYFVGDPDVAHLKVSFFGPIYGSYAVFELDKQDYQHAFVSGSSTRFLWFLSRTPTVSKEKMDQFMSLASELGFDTSKLVIVNQEPRS